MRPAAARRRRGAQLGLGLAQGHGDPPLLPAEELLALDHHQGPVQGPHPGRQPGGADLPEAAAQALHAPAPRGIGQGRRGGAVRQGQGDQRVIAGALQVQLELLAPEAPIPDHGALARAAGRGVQRLMQPPEALEAGGQDRLVGAIARIGPVQQRDVPRLADQHAQAHHAQSPALALGLAPARQLPRGGRRDVGVEVRRVKGQHVRGQAEAPHGLAGEGELRRLQLRVRDPGGQPMKGLPREPGGGHAAEPRHAPGQERRQGPLRARRAGPVDGHRQHQLARRGARAPGARPEGRIQVPHHVELLGDPAQRPHVPHPARPEGARPRQGGHGGGIGRPQQHLPGDRLPPARIPHGLGRHAVGPPPHEALEDEHVLSTSTKPPRWQAFSLGEPAESCGLRARILRKSG